MRSFFRRNSEDPTPVIEPVLTEFPKIEGAEIAAAFAGQRIAGDFYDAIRVSSERVLFGLLDVAGRREDARPLLAVAQQIFRDFGTDLFSRADINESEAMAELSLRINRGLIAASPTVKSCPAFIACYHEKFGTLCYTNAGHTPGLLRDKAGVSELVSTGLPLGLFSHATSEAPTIGVAKGSVLLLVSRGVVSCENHHDHQEEFGLERVKQILQESPSGGAQALCSFVLTQVSDFCRNAPMHDDRTALALIRNA